MTTNHHKTKTEDAYLGADCIVQPGVTVGLQYHKDAGPAHIGNHAMLRTGTIIYGDVQLGDHFQTGHYVIIRAKVKTGDYCTLCNQSTLEGLVRFGTGVRIMSHVYIPSRTWFGDHVFVGPGTTFLNDKRPGRLDNMPTPRGATIEDHVVIGGGCTILPGVTIGHHSFIAAGALVTKDIPPRSLVIGSPGKISPLPDDLDRDNNATLTIQPIDIWHPAMPNLAEVDWPKDWPKEANQPEWLV